MAGGQRWRGEQVSMKRQHCIREKHTLLIHQKPSIYRDFHKEKIHDLSFQSQNVWSSCPFSFRTPFKKKTKKNKKKKLLNLLYKGYSISTGLSRQGTVSSNFSDHWRVRGTSEAVVPERRSLRRQVSYK